MSFCTAAAATAAAATAAAAAAAAAAATAAAAAAAALRVKLLCGVRGFSTANNTEEEVSLFSLAAMLAAEGIGNGIGRKETNGGSEWLCCQLSLSSGLFKHHKRAPNDHTERERKREREREAILSLQLTSL